MPSSTYIKYLSNCRPAVGNFSVQYNFQSISVVLLVMSASVCTTDDDSCRAGEQAAWVHSASTSTVFLGAITGQLTMGYAGDVFGRNAAMTLTLSLVAVSALLSAVLPLGDAPTVYIFIIVSRFILGIGVGGIYPLAATKAAEDGAQGGKSVKVSSAAWSFVWQVPGTMAPWAMAYVLTYSGLSTDMKWRLLLGLGAVPAAIVVALSTIERQLQLKENIDLSPLSRANSTGLGENEGDHDYLIQAAEMDTETETETDSTSSTLATNPKSPIGNPHHLNISTISSNSITSIYSPIGSVQNESNLESGVHNGRPRQTSVTAATDNLIMNMLKEPDTWRKLAITGGCWFIYDVAYYGVNLFGGEILQSISNSDDDNVSLNASIRGVAVKQIIAAGTAFPATIISIWVLELVGLKALQAWGFLFISVCFVGMAVTIVPLNKDNDSNILFGLYCLLLFSLSFGPNLTTYILPAQVFPKEVRTTFNGRST